ncbi:MAG: septation protein IspZ, partial [Acidithiobacillus sp.]|nr:septation protein IspZ [Acidithiobacillus sp.]
VLNLIVAYAFSTGIWVDFKLFGMLAITVIFVLFQAVVISRALPQEAKDGDSSA